MDLHDDPSLQSAIATSRLSCRRCTYPFLPTGLDEATRGVCARCSAPGDWPTSQIRRSTPLGLAPEARAPRPRTKADLALISKVHGYMAAAQLLRVLNERMEADLGDEAPPYTAHQLHEAIQQLQQAPPATGWSNVRRMLAEARKAPAASESG